MDKNLVKDGPGGEYIYTQPPLVIKQQQMGLKPGLPAESPTMIFATPKVSTGTGATVDYMGENRVPDLQRFFQKSDGLPVHLKRGYPDRLLYRTTMALTVGGVAYCLVALFIAAQPNKK